MVRIAGTWAARTVLGKEAYDRRMQQLGRKLAVSVDKMFPLVEAQPGKEIIVSGAGEGETSEWLASKTGASITGVDPSEERGERAEAAQHLRRLAEGSGDRAERARLFEQLGDVVQSLGDDNGACKAYTEALAHDAESALAYLGRGDLYRTVGELDRAIKDFTEVIRLDPTGTAGYHNRAAAYVGTSESRATSGSSRYPRY